MFRFFRRKKGVERKRGPEQPLGPFQYSDRLRELIAEMLGLIRKVLADGVVSEEEAQALAAWTEAHPEVVEAWPGKVLAHRLERIFEDGAVDEVEQADLQRLLRALAGGDWGVRMSAGRHMGVPLTEPPPVLVFPEQCVAFAGEFAHGPIATCEEVVKALGGTVVRKVTPEVDVLIVGGFGTSDWRSSPDAKEIQIALDLQKGGHSIAIVSEDHWASSLPES